MTTPTLPSPLQGEGNRVKALVQIPSPLHGGSWWGVRLQHRRIDGFHSN